MMAENFENVHNEPIVKIYRLTSFNPKTQMMDIVNIDSPELLELYQPSMDNTEEVYVAPVVVQNEVVSNMTIERFPKLQQRLSILPLYPTKESNHQSHPLLTNIPLSQLTQTEAVRRYANAFKPAFDIMNHDSMIPSFLREKYLMFFGDLIERLKVDMTILDYNYTRLNKYMKVLIEERIQLFSLRPHEIQQIDEQEYPLALEFFLQFDVNMFYMKTCSFRFARPRSMNEGLFCLQEPEARYELAACGNCGLCYPQYDMTHRSKKRIVEYSQAHKHTFVNGYEAILNCSASCHTQNIIYALTCPCGNVDYIGETLQSLHDRLHKHREHGNRIIHEFLLGQENIKNVSIREKTKEILTKDRMRLYQHSTRCPVAMQIFLDANPQYWRFIPMTLEESQTPEQQQIQRPILSDELDLNIRARNECMACIEAVPRPARGYIFSNRQIVLQTKYFHTKRDRDMPNQDIDLYNATSVAVLPQNCSDMFRWIIESLFITYAETNLNSIGNVLNQDQNHNYYPLNDPWLIRGDQWCQGLVRRPLPRSTTTTRMITNTR